MISYGLDSNNDLIVENGAFKTVEDGAETVQHVRTRLLFYLEEWFLDLAAGTAYFQLIFVKPVDLARVESELKTRILQTPEVQSLIEFEMDFNSETRLLNVTFSAETTYGTIDKVKVTIND